MSSPTHIPSWPQIFETQIPIIDTVNPQYIMAAYASVSSRSTNIVRFGDSLL